MVHQLNFTQRLADIAVLRVMKYFGHVIRSGRNLETPAMQAKVQGKNLKGRPLQRWTADMIIKQSGLSLYQCIKRANDRRECVQRFRLLHDHDTLLGERLDHDNNLNFIKTLLEFIFSTVLVKNNCWKRITLEKGQSFDLIIINFDDKSHSRTHYVSTHRYV